MDGADLPAEACFAQDHQFRSEAIDSAPPKGSSRSRCRDKPRHSALATVRRESVLGLNRLCKLDVGREMVREVFSSRLHRSGFEDTQIGREQLPDSHGVALL